MSCVIGCSCNHNQTIRQKCDCRSPPCNSLAATRDTCSAECPHCFGTRTAVHAFMNTRCQSCAVPPRLVCEHVNIRVAIRNVCTAPSSCAKRRDPLLVDVRTVPIAFPCPMYHVIMWYCCTSSNVERYTRRVPAFPSCWCFATVQCTDGRSSTEYVKVVNDALAREDGLMLEACLNMDPQAIPDGQRLLEARLSDVRQERKKGGMVAASMVICK